MKPMAKDVDRMNRFRLVQDINASTRTPATAMVLYRKTCIPPKTEGGIEAKMAPNLPNMPMRMRKPEAHHPALRLAQPVNTMTPLFPAWPTIGPAVPSALNRLPKPSQRMPPCMRLLKRVPSISTPEISAVARTAESRVSYQITKQEGLL